MTSGMAVAIATARHSLYFATGFVGAVTCFTFAAALAGFTQYRAWLISQRRLNGQCPQCGFDLRHSPDHCPECGSPVVHADRKHMTVTFTASEAGAVSEANFTKIWLASASPRHVLTLQRSTGTDVYLTFDLEPHSTPGHILSCSLTADTLQLHVTGYFNNRYDHFKISLAVAQDQYFSLGRALRGILAGTYAKLSIQ